MRGRLAVLAMVLVGCWTVVTIGAAEQETAAPAVAAAETADHVAADTRSVWDGVYTVDQARRGRRVYQDECGSCHKVEEFHQGYSTAVDLFDSRFTMPESAPGALTEQAYADLIAYVFQEAEMPPGETELPGDGEVLKLIRIEARPPDP